MKAKTISHILTIIGLVLVILGTVYFIVQYNFAKAEVAQAANQEQIDEIVRNYTGGFLLYVGLGAFLTVIILLTGTLFYAFGEQSKKAGPMFFLKIASVVLPMVLLVFYILIWMTLK